MKPKAFRINLIFECPTCHAEHWYDGRELKHNPILICCDNVIELKPVKDIIVNIKYNDKVPEKAIDILKSYGFTKEDILTSNIKASNPEDFVKKFLASQTDDTSSNTT